MSEKKVRSSSSSGDSDSENDSSSSNDNERKKSKREGDFQNTSKNLKKKETSSEDSKDSSSTASSSSSGKSDDNKLEVRRKRSNSRESNDEKVCFKKRKVEKILERKDGSDNKSCSKQSGDDHEVQDLEEKSENVRVRNNSPKNLLIEAQGENKRSKDAQKESEKRNRSPQKRQDSPKSGVDDRNVNSPRAKDTLSRNQESKNIPSSPRHKTRNSSKSPSPRSRSPIGRNREDKLQDSKSNYAVQSNSKSHKELQQQKEKDELIKKISKKSKRSSKDRDIKRRSKTPDRDRHARSKRPSSKERQREKSKERERSGSRERKRRDSKERRYKGQDGKVQENEKSSEKISERQRRTVDLLTSRTGGAYIPPAKLRLLQAEITDKSSAAYQRIAWEALKKSIHGYINKVNVDNIGIITRELLKENIIRGRGLLCRSIIQAQAASPTFTHVYAALVAIINSKFPNIGELLLKRLVIQFKRGFRRNDKNTSISSARFIAHLVNQRVAHEILALEILTLLVETPTDDSVEVAISFLKECGMKLSEVSAKGVNAIFEMLKNILHEGKLDKRVQYMIEVVFQVRKDGFKDHQSVIEALELVEEDDQYTHLIMLDEATDGEDALNVFKFDDKYESNEDRYKGLSKEILGSDADDSESGSEGSGSGESDDEDNEEEKDKSDLIIDNTETNLIALRRTIYLTIHSSLDYEECAHKLMKMELKPGQEMELCHMFLDCCAEQRTYEKFYGLLAQRFCTINKVYVEPFEKIFHDTYHTTHRLDTNRLRNVSKFFAHLLFTDAIGWEVLTCIKLNEDDTTSSSRIFIKILFQELAEYMGLSKLNERLKDVTLTESFAGLFPRDNPRNTRFAINFFTSIGLGGLTDELREFLKSAPKSVAAINAEILEIAESSSSSSTSSSSSSSSDSSNSSDSSTDSDSSSSKDSSEKRKKNKKGKDKRRTKNKNKKKKHSSTSSSSDDEEECEKRIRTQKTKKHQKYRKDKENGDVASTEHPREKEKREQERRSEKSDNRGRTDQRDNREQRDRNRNQRGRGKSSPEHERSKKYDDDRKESRRRDDHLRSRDELKKSSNKDKEQHRSKNKSLRGISKERG